MTDQFYTTVPVAKQCYQLLLSNVNIGDYDIILEPSAGTGSFFNLLPPENRKGIDLEPKCKDVQKLDFFDFKQSTNNTYLVVGNPPFGRISSLAIRFFNKSATFADCIAFIIPRTFKRTSVQNKLSLYFKLVLSQDLPLTPCCFRPKMSAKCCFQIWKRTEFPREKIIYKKNTFRFQIYKTRTKRRKKPTNTTPRCRFRHESVRFQLR